MNDNALIIAEREITSLKLLKLFNMSLIVEFNFEALCKIHKMRQLHITGL